MSTLFPRWIGVLGISVVVALAGSGCGGGGNEEAMNSDRWSDIIHIGMTEAEVIGVVGRPPDGQYTDSRYSQPNPFYSWRYGNDRAAVAYDADGKVAVFSYATDLYGQ